MVMFKVKMSAIGVISTACSSLKGYVEIRDANQP